MKKKVKEKYKLPVMKHLSHREVVNSTGKISIILQSL